ncbi:L,D-transpeptidase [Candidatus Uhrbacteria bacterium]|nr:L,D-transpeptidase [Candidatus Uhrbacteria bacterium]
MRPRIVVTAVFLSLVLLFVFCAVPTALAASDVDADSDGILDALEEQYGTDPLNSDTDGDSYSDGVEIRSGYDPKDPQPVKLRKRIEIDRKAQLLQYAVGPYVLGEHRVSTGKPKTPTPKGTFRIVSKNNRAWSRRANLWMPKWMNFTGPGAPAGRFGIHELPEWRSGKKEGASHLGVPVSGGCVRLGVGPAQTLYAWADVGTTVEIR